MLKQAINSPWSFMRILRLILGAVFLFGGLIHRDNLAVFAGAFFLFQGVFSLGCGGAQSCAQTNKTHNNQTATEPLEIDFEEVKPKH
jgi:hypothetical protein